jgi:hypothetical protein
MLIKLINLCIDMNAMKIIGWKTHRSPINQRDQGYTYSLRKTIMTPGLYHKNPATRALNSLISESIQTALVMIFISLKLL